MYKLLLFFSFFFLFALSCSNKKINKKSTASSISKSTGSNSGSSSISIQLASTLSEETMKQIEDCKEHLQKMTGYNVSLNKSSAPYQISLRKDAGLLKSNGVEAFRLQSSNSKKITISGASDLAIQNGFYTLLELLGCRWFFPGENWNVIPSLSTLSFPSINKVYEPQYTTRRFAITYGFHDSRGKDEYNRWQQRNRMISGKSGLLGHTYVHIANPDKHFDTHPEWYALMDGKRNPGGQLCVSNEEIQARAVNYAVRFFKKKPAASHVSITPNDGSRWCECSPCQQLGNVTDQTLFLSNHVARSLKKTHPGKMVLFNAYHTAAEAANRQVEDNVIIKISTFFHESSLITLLEEWSEKTDNLGYREFHNLLMTHRDLPRWTIDKSQHHLQLGQKYDIEFHQTQAGFQWGPEGLNYYVLPALLWNPDADTEAIISDFYSKAFGSAKVPMKRYYERTKSPGKGISNNMISLYLADLNEAAGLTNDPAVIRRINDLKLYIHWMGLYMENQQAKGPAATQAAEKALRFAWEIRDTYMVHSRAQFKLATKIYKGIDKTNAVTIKVRAKETAKNYSQVQIDKLFREDLAKYGAGVTISTKNYSSEFKSVGSKAPQNVKLSKSISYSAKDYFVLHLDQSQQVNLNIKPDPNSRGRGNLFLCPYGDCSFETAIQTHEITAKGPNTISLGRLDKGTYHIMLRMKRMPISLPPMQGLLWDLSSEFRGNANRNTRRQYFYVPKGTKNFSIKFTVAHGPDPRVVVYGPKGEKILDEKRPCPVGGEFIVKVPQDKVDKVWSFSVSETGAINNLSLIGVPPFVTNTPSELKVPSETLR